MRERHAIVTLPVPEMVAHFVLKPIEEAEQLWLNFRVEWRHKSNFVSAVVHSLQAHLIHSAMTLFQPAPRSSLFSRSLVDSSCPNHQTPCWGTVERYKDTSAQMHPCSLSLSHTLKCPKTKRNSSVPSFRLSIHLWKWRSSACQWIAVRNRQELLTTMVRGTQQKSVWNFVFHFFKAPCFTASPALCGGSLFLYTNLTKSSSANSTWTTCVFQLVTRRQFHFRDFEVFKSFSVLRCQRCLLFLKKKTEGNRLSDL